MEVVMIIIYVLAGIAVLVLLFTLYCYYSTFYHSERMKKSELNAGAYKKAYDSTKILVDELNGYKYEEVSVKAFDNTALVGSYYRFAESAPNAILFHGYRAWLRADNAALFKLFRESGFNILVVDQRAHGRSAGHTISFGINERRDCLTWVNYINERFGKPPVILAGVSMGAATVMMAMGLGLPDNVIGVVADCGFSSPSGIIKKVAKDRGFAPSLVFPFVKLAARLFGVFDLSEADALSAVKASKLPLLLIHGDKDGFVPHYMSEEICDARPQNTTLVTVHGADHALAYATDSDLYSRTVNDFTDRVLNDRLS